MTGFLTKVRRRLARDRDLPLGELVAKGTRFVAATALAPLRLRGADVVGPRARTVGRPRIVNRGWLGIGADFNCASMFAPVDLTTAPGGRIEIGDRVAINYGTSIHAAARVRLGNDVSIGPNSILWDSERGGEQGAHGQNAGETAAIEIGDGVWLAGRVTVLPGATIGAGSVITAGSIVGGVIPAGVVAGGIPARVLRHTGAVPAADAANNGDVAERSRAREAQRPMAAAAEPVAPSLRGVVLSDFTIGDLAVRMRDARERPSVEVVETPFGQVVQSLMQPPADGASDFAVIWTRPDVVSPTFQRILTNDGGTDAELLADVETFCDLIDRAAPSYRVVLVPTWTLPPHQRGLGMIDARPGGVTWSLALMNQRLMQRFAASGQTFVLNAARWVEQAGRGASAERAWYMGKVAFHGEALAAAARDVKAALRGIAGEARKLLVLDLDDTVWGGIVGDVGWENLQLGGHDATGEAFVDFQRAAKQLTRRGIVLGVASKNTESVAIEAMREHPEMVLKPDDFVALRINWNDKARNIADMAQELNLGLQSVVFIDDNPVERARVREALPDVQVPEWPEDKLLYPSALLSLPFFDAPSVSREDVERTGMYAAERQRETLKQAVGSLDDWLLSLGIRARAEPLGSANLARTVQLLNKTNQMNLSTRRPTERELLDWVRGDGRMLWAVHVSDRFGDAGLTGVVSVEQDARIARIVDFVLSCRVMGRRIEDSMVALAVEWARARGLAQVVADYRPTAKNKPCHDFWKASPFARDDDATRFTWDATRAFARPTCVTVDVAAR